MKLLLLLLSCLLSPAVSLTQSLGIPEIFNFSKESYAAGTQNWDIVQDHSLGIMYVANNEGLLTFDGTSWKLYPLPNKTIVRSVAMDADRKIYVGGQGELGYFEAGDNGRLVYHSLLPLIPASNKSFADVWNVVPFGKSVFFLTSRYIFEFNGNNVTSFSANEWQFLGTSGGLLLAQDVTKGLLQYKNGLWRPFGKHKLTPGTLITSLVPSNKKDVILTTLKNGCFRVVNNDLVKWQTSDLAEVSARNIYTATRINDEQLLLGTSESGCFVVDTGGRIRHHFSRRDGLQNNNVLSVFTDKYKNLWLGLDHGIDLISYNNAVKHIYPDAEKDASGYAALMHNGHLYLGTSNGVYRTRLTNAPYTMHTSLFERIANTSGQVWNLSEVNNKVLLGHHEGAFTIEGDKAVPFDKSSGFWNFLPLSTVLPSSVVVAGNYKGVGFYDFKQNQFFPNQTAAFESARFVLVDDETVWVSHPYKGIYRVNSRNGMPAVMNYGKNKGITSVNNNYIFKIRNRILVATEDGLLEYNHAQDRFEPSDYFNKHFKGLVVRYLKEDQDGNIWFVFKKNLGVLDLSGATPSMIYITELNNKMVSGFEHVYPINKENIIVGAEKGFYHINLEKYKKYTHGIQAGIRNVVAFNKTDSLLFGGFPAAKNGEETQPSISYQWNTFLFEYSSTLFGQQSNIEYSIKLDGFDQAWSDWTKKTSKEYTNLPAGTYTFKVVARNNLGNQSEESTYTFTVLPPWYLTTWAYLFYVICILFAVYLAYSYQKKKFKLQQIKHHEEQEKLKYLHELELEHNERQIVQLKNENLEAQIDYKNKELASVAMHLVQKGELLRKIREELTKLTHIPSGEKTTDSVKKIIRILNEEEKMDEDWEYFAAHFDKVHSHFLVALKEHHPNLTANELKLSAYLRMNLSTKEIAQLMNISVRGVEISRYRLRKKLGIPTEVNLFNYLINFNAPAKEKIISVAGAKELLQ